MYFSFLLTSIAALSTCIGYLFTYMSVKNIDRFICISLSFAGGVMTFISIKELIPIPLKYIYKNNNLITFYAILVIIPILTYIIFKILNKMLKNNHSLYRVGILTTISLILHNIPEGIVTFMTSLTNVSLGIKLTFAIMAHNIPEGISISIPIYFSTKSRGKAFTYTLIAGISEIFGALLIYILFKKYITIEVINIILYLIGCLMITISIKEILPEVLKYNNRNWIAIGLLLSLFILLI